jgi:hypothetical protein
MRVVSPVLLLSIIKLSTSTSSSQQTAPHPYEKQHAPPTPLLLFPSAPIDQSAAHERDHQSHQMGRTALETKGKRLMHEAASLRQLQMHQWEKVPDEGWLTLGHAGQASSIASPPPRMEVPVASTSSTSEAEQDSSPSTEGMSVSEYRRHRAERKIRFQQEWKKKKLGPHLTPMELAKQVHLIHVEDIAPNAVGRWSREMLWKDSRLPPMYYIDYSNALAKLNGRIAYYKKSVEKEIGSHSGPPLSDHEKKEKAFQLMDKLDQRKALASSYRAPIQVRAMQEAAQRAAMVGRHFEEHMKEKKKMDITKMSTQDIEEHSRDLKVAGMDNAVQGRLLRKYLATHRADVINLDVFQHLRAKSHRKKGDDLRYEQHKAAREGHSRETPP